MEQIPQGKRRLLLQMKDGTQKKITIPDDWKVTFGPLHPGKQEGNGGHTALRCWSGSKTKEIQHAVFTDVASFRDMSIEIMEEREERKEERFVREGGSADEAVMAEVRVKKWVNPDEPTQKPSAFDSNNFGQGQLVRLVRKEGS